MGRQEILPGLKTEIWGYDGIFPGPTIESRRGRRAIVRHRNELDVPTVVHLHGGVTPPEHDGYPTDVILPVGGRGGHGGHDGHGTNVSEGTREYVYPLQQPAATLWYHDHRMDFTGPQVYKGLAGFHLVRDDEEESLGLPAGERDVPLMICGRSLLCTWQPSGEVTEAARRPRGPADGPTEKPVRCLPRPFPTERGK